MTNRDLANQPCAEPGCDKKRVINATGYVQPYCAEHKRMHMKEWEANRAEKNLANGKVKAKRQRKTTCAHEGCSEPRYIAPGGSAHKFCSSHYNEYQRDLKAKKRAAKPLTEAQQHAGFDGNPDAVASKGEVRKVCFIDRTSDTMIFLEIKITRCCKTGELEMHPLAWQGVTESITAKGYKIVERGERPEGARHV